jgi:hypothetical protein
MSGSTKSQPAEFSRRSVIRHVAIAAAGAATIFGANSVGNRQAAAQTKASQKAVGYQSTPKGAQQCDNCTQFAAPASCKVVEGDIAAAGWCKMYVKKPA